MNAPVRRAINFSDDPATLARQVGELARDLYQRTRYELSEAKWGGIVSFLDDRVKPKVDVGKTKPLAIVAVDVEDVTNRSKLLPGGVRWQWVDGQARIDDMWTPFAGDTEYRITFLVIRKGGV